MSILVVDPNPSLGRLFSQELEEAGYSTITAPMNEAWRLVSELRPEAIVLNATVALERGVALLRAIRGDAELCSTPVVGIAFYPGWEQALLSAGADCCLRDLPAAGDVLKGVEWALMVYGERRAP